MKKVFALSLIAMSLVACGDRTPARESVVSLSCKPTMVKIEVDGDQSSEWIQLPRSHSSVLSISKSTVKVIDTDSSKVLIMDPTPKFQDRFVSYDARVMTENEVQPQSFMLRADYETQASV